MLLKRSDSINILWIWLYALIGHIAVSIYPIPSHMISKVHCSMMLIANVMIVYFITRLASVKPTISQKLYLLILVVFALGDYVRIFGYIFEVDPNYEHVINNRILMLYAGVLAVVYLLYPIEVLHPRYLRIKTILKLLSPVLLNVFFVIISDYFRGDNQDFIAEIVYIINIIFISGYPIIIFIYIIIYQKKYKKWYKQNYSNIDRMDIFWVKYYIVGYLSLTVSYLWTSIPVSQSGYLVHYSMFILFFVLTFPFVLLQNRSQDDISIVDNDEFELDNINRAKADCLDNDEVSYKYKDNISLYKAKLENWMTESKPFLNVDFRLIDLTEILPMNRNYISKLINEEYGENFFSFVMRHRIDYSIEMLKKHPELTITQIANLTGFSSPSVFGRSFLKAKGISPAKYRDNITL